MRRVLLLCLLGAVLTIVATAPAWAQARDPFDPVVNPTPTAPAGEVDTTGALETPAPAQTTAPTQPPAEAPGTEGLPNTGADTDPWLVVAYGLIATGLGAIAISKAMESRPTASRA